MCETTDIFITTYVCALHWQQFIEKPRSVLLFSILFYNLYTCILIVNSFGVWIVSCVSWLYANFS